MPKKIILIRHGETQDNIDSKFQGWIDTPLTSNGRKAAKTLARLFSSFHPDPVHAIYSSDLIRAHETASLLACQLKLPVIKEPRLREHHLGIIAGWKFSNFTPEQAKLWASFLSARDNLDLDWHEHQGETMRQFLRRVKALLADLSLQHTNQTVILVTHGGTINRLLEIIGYKKTNDIYLSISNTSITTIVKRGNKRVVSELNLTLVR